MWKIKRFEQAGFWNTFFSLKVLKPLNFHLFKYSQLLCCKAALPFNKKFELPGPISDGQNGTKSTFLT